MLHTAKTEGATMRYDLFYQERTTAGLSRKVRVLQHAEQAQIDEYRKKFGSSEACWTVEPSLRPVII